MIVEFLQVKVNKVASNRKEQKRFAKFAIVGAIGAMVDFLVFNVLVELVRLAPLHANPFSVGAAIVSNFTWNRLWSFPESRKRPVVKQFVQFASINLLGLIINQTIMWIMLHYVLAEDGIGTSIERNLAKAFAIGVVLFWNFGINRLWTYRGL